VCYNPTADPVVSHRRPIRSFSPYFSAIHFNIILPDTLLTCIRQVLTANQRGTAKVLTDVVDGLMVLWFDRSVKKVL
jgi:hypothetical protein